MFFALCFSFSQAAYSDHIEDDKDYICFTDPYYSFVIDGECDNETIALEVAKEGALLDCYEQGHLKCKITNSSYYPNICKAIAVARTCHHKEKSSVFAE